MGGSTAMAGIDDVLDRLISDQPFRDRLHGDPAAALDDYALSPDDLKLLAARLDMPALLSLLDEERRAADEAPG